MDKKTPPVFTPIIYYGGKTQLIPELVPLFDNCKEELFVSLFTGGGAIEFAIKPRPVEFWNDINSAIITFYEVLETPYMYHRFKKKLNAMVYSEKIFRVSYETYKRLRHKEHKTCKEKIALALAIYQQCNNSYAGGIGKGFAFSFKQNMAVTHHNRIAKFNKTNYLGRMKNITLFNRDAIKLFDMCNRVEDVIYYADPPYYNSDMGHYQGYTLRDFTRLLWRLSTCKGKFVLSSYDSEILGKYVAKHKWFCKKIVKPIAAGRFHSDKPKSKTECITTNFDPVNAVSETMSLF